MSDTTPNFCTKCGTALVDGACPKCSQGISPQKHDSGDKYKRFL